jgi:hypothetical protein
MSDLARISASEPTLAGARPLLTVLESLWPVAFDRPGAGVTASIVATGASSLVDAPLTLHMPEPGEPSADRDPVVDVHFADDSDVPWPYRGRRVRAPLRVSAERRVVAAAEKVLASDASGMPLWTVERQMNRRVWRSHWVLGSMAGDSDATSRAGGAQFLHALPLFHLVREASGDHGHALPPLRAAFMVDDPNLHWPRYGFVDFRAIAALAEEVDFHVAFATIPLDAWFTHRASAALFRAHRTRISLLIHGNDHGRNELAVPRTVHESAALLDQAVDRIESLERKANLQISRVMVPPHGACSESMLAQLPLHGFESACISAGSLRAHNADRPWTGALGFAPSETVAGCTVLPRWSLTSSGPDVLLAAAYLGQPLILRAHHQDLKDGLDAFATAARFVNSLGSVCWSDMTTISRLNYRARRVDSEYHVRPLGHTVALEVPQGIDHVVVEAEAAPLTVCGRQDGPARVDPHGRTVIPVIARDTVTITRSVRGDEASTRLRGDRHRTPPHLVVRRLLTEARDRLLVK